MMSPDVPDLTLRRLLKEGWPEQSVDYVKRFGHQSARLYPFLGEDVETDQGSGTLLAVRGEMSLVVLDSTEAVQLYDKKEKTKPMSEVSSREIRPRGMGRKTG